MTARCEFLRKERGSTKEQMAPRYPEFLIQESSLRRRPKEAAGVTAATRISLRVTEWREQGLDGNVASAAYARSPAEARGRIGSWPPPPPHESNEESTGDEEEEERGEGIDRTFGLAAPLCLRRE